MRRLTYQALSLALAAGLTGPAARAQTLAATSSVALSVPAALASAPFDAPRTVQVPTGWALAVYARVPGARFMALTPDGALLVSQPGAGKISLVRPGSADASPTVTDFATGLRRPHDMVFHTIGSTTYLYVAESNQINRFTYQAGDATAQGRQVIITGLPDDSTPELNGAYAHALKNLALDGNHKLYVSIASTCNVCLSDTQSDPKRAAIYQYEADGTGRRLFAQGLRNAEGLAFIPGTNTLWVTVNGRDNTPYPKQDATGQYGQVLSSYVDNHPPDLFTKVVDGGNYGWPFANPNPDSSTGLDNMPFELDYDMNRDGAVPLSTFTTISKGIQAHSAALGFTFLQGTRFPAAYASGAAVALHGSWNRTAPAGYKVIYFPWNAATQTPGAQADLVTGFVDGGGAWGRPVDVAVDAQGALLISDDQSGTIYKLTAPAAALGARASSSAATIHFYPNPAGSGPATLDLTGLPTGAYQATVLDALGRPVLPPQRVAGGALAPLPLGGLGAGAYLVRVQGEQFSQVLKVTVK
ncbi:T9SS type A sorting domain-containing protein [Hymenobacter polaris]|nr:T9SS type A sorting domain-containing protein [Hymenobacter polaris]